MILSIAGIIFSIILFLILLWRINDTRQELDAWAGGQNALNVKLWDKVKELERRSK